MCRGVAGRCIVVYCCVVYCPGLLVVYDCRMVESFVVSLCRECVLSYGRLVVVVCLHRRFVVIVM